jgi:hypothetical protein
MNAGVGIHDILFNLSLEVEVLCPNVRKLIHISHEILRYIVLKCKRTLLPLLNLLNLTLQRFSLLVNYGCGISLVLEFFRTTRENCVNLTLLLTH